MSDVRRRDLLLYGGAGGVVAAVASVGAVVARPGPAAAHTATANCINPRTDNSAFGAPNAVGNGSVDDTAAIQASLNLAALFAGNGGGAGCVMLPTGTYRVTSTVTMPSNVTLFSEIPATARANESIAPLIDGSGLTSGPVLLFDRSDAAVLRNVKVRGPELGTSTHFTVSCRNTCHGLVFEGCAFHRGGAGAVEWRNVATSWFLNNAVGGNGEVGTGLLLSQSPDNLIHGNQMTTGLLAGLPNNPTEPNGQGDALVIEASDHNVVSGNFIFFAFNGVRLGGNRHTVVGNRIDTNWARGIVVPGQGSVINGNLFHTNGRSQQDQLQPILLEASSRRCNVVGNGTFSDNPLEPFAPCQLPGVRNLAGTTGQHEIGFSGPVVT